MAAARPYLTRGRGDRLLDPVVPPEHLAADDERWDADHPQLGCLVGRLAQRPLDPFGFDGLEERAGVKLAGGGGDQHVVGLAQVAPGGEGLAESGEGEGDGAPGLLGEGRGAHREQRVPGPWIRPDQRRQPVDGRPPLDLGHPLGTARPVPPRVAAEALEEPAEQDRLPLRLLQPGLGEKGADPLRGQVGVGGAEVEVEGGWRSASLGVDRPTPRLQRAASRIASEIVG